MDLKGNEGDEESLTRAQRIQPPHSRVPAVLPLVPAACAQSAGLEFFEAPFKSPREVETLGVKEAEPRGPIPPRFEEFSQCADAVVQHWRIAMEYHLVKMRVERGEDGHLASESIGCWTLGIREYCGLPAKCVNGRTRVPGIPVHPKVVCPESVCRNQENVAVLTESETCLPLLWGGQ